MQNSDGSSGGSDDCFVVVWGLGGRVSIKASSLLSVENLNKINMCCLSDLVYQIYSSALPGHHLDAQCNGVFSLFRCLN